MVSRMEEEDLGRERRSAEEPGRCSAVGEELGGRKWRMSAKGGSMAKMADRRCRKRQMSAEGESRTKMADAEGGSMTKMADECRRSGG